ncbi:10635_t:CDS:2, partial [Funneliformis geosporum]
SMPELTSSVQVLNQTSTLKEVNRNTMAAPVGILRNVSNTRSKPTTTLNVPIYDTSDSEQEGFNQTEYGYETEPEKDVNPQEARETLLHEHLIKSGYLNKKQERRKNWKRRWFVLRSTKLAYYKSDKEYELLKILDMNDVHSVAEVKLKNKLNVFYIVTSKRTYYVQAANKEELDEWVEAINKVKKVQEEEFLYEDTGSQADSEDMSEKTPSVLRISTQLATQQVKSPLSGSTSPVLNNSLALSPEKTTAAIDIPSRTQLQSSDYNAEGGHSFASASSYTSAGSIPNISSSPSSPVAGQYAKDSSDPTASSEDEEGYEDMVDEIDDGRIIHKGFVYKLDRYKKIWKKRWFVLKNDRLFYYKNPNPK